MQTRGICVARGCGELGLFAHEKKVPLPTFTRLYRIRGLGSRVFRIVHVDSHFHLSRLVTALSRLCHGSIMRKGPSLLTCHGVTAPGGKYTPSPSLPSRSPWAKAGCRADLPRQSEAAAGAPKRRLACRAVASGRRLAPCIAHSLGIPLRMEVWFCCFPTTCAATSEVTGKHEPRHPMSEQQSATLLHPPAQHPEA
jgi:hypothetical protein